MSLPKSFEAKNIESKWYETWKTLGIFTADPNSSKKPYCIVIPPPNVTGVLHMGHALVNTLQDVLIRWKKMSGYETLWVPGTDHAGIATQTVVERHLIKTEGKRRKDYSREQFLEKVWAWKEANANLILKQIERMGCSCDWSRLRFTMDEKNNLAVKKMFKLLFDKGLIYRGDYLVNWDPISQTALADDEVEYEERKGWLWHFKYPLEEGGFLSIATTRPETLLGDTAVAVSPKDSRYAHLIGKNILLPLSNRKIPIIADPFVDPSFGTGAVKVTPAHDPNDYEMAFRHNLPLINILTPDGKIEAAFSSFAGLSIQEARDKVIQEMKALNLLEKIEPHTLRVGVSYRSKATIEPYLSKQWFVRMSEFKTKLQKIVKEEKTKLLPKSFENTYFHWIENLRDWCISRQLWWGHQIPVWFSKKEAGLMICQEGEELPQEVKETPHDWQQDEDVLDTWFSSALWPFAALGWPEKTKEMAKFYPNSTLITGHDILFFWVARMLMMGEFATDTPPFPETFLHGLIFGKSYWRSEKEGGIHYVSEEERLAYDLGKPLPKDVSFKWEKMSKSKGNVIDPIEMIDLYGADAVRMALCASATQSREIDLDRRKFEEFKNFSNKIWNGARFIFLNLEASLDEKLPSLSPVIFSEGLENSLFKIEDNWIFARLKQTAQEVNEHLSSYQFDLAASLAYDFFWKDFCAYYLEIIKPVLFGKIGSRQERCNKQKILSIILCDALCLMHPMAPFITEELFHKLKEKLGNFIPKEGCDPHTKRALTALQKECCTLASYPLLEPLDQKEQEALETFEKLKEIIYTLRNLRGEMGVPPAEATDLYVIGSSDSYGMQLFKKDQHVILALVKIHNLYFKEEEPKLHFFSTGLAEGLKLLLPLPKQRIEQEKKRLTKKKEHLEAHFLSLTKQLADPSFLKNAPVSVVEKQKQLLNLTKNDLDQVLNKLEEN